MSNEKSQAIYDWIKAHPGCTPTEVGRGVGLSADAVRVRLAGFDRLGLLLYEEEGGKLYPFRKRTKHRKGFCGPMGYGLDRPGERKD